MSRHVCVMSDSCLCAITANRRQVRGDEADQRLYSPNDARLVYAGTQWGRGIESFSWFHTGHQHYRRSFDAGFWWMAGNNFMLNEQVVPQFPADAHFIAAINSIAAHRQQWCNGRGGVVLYGTFSYFKKAYPLVSEEGGRLFMAHMGRLREEFIQRGVPVLWLQDTDLWHIPLGGDHAHVLECVGSREAQRELMHAVIECILKTNDDIEVALQFGADERELRRCLKVSFR